ncbi:SLC13 family permease [Psychromonas sp. GE-S-Ul-11]|uniref:SLC13 family permease n=1 Tax=Psychromonas sp. GE-S-Ul-11 TaxID=3241170 RepID=UPI00390CBC45
MENKIGIKKSIAFVFILFAVYIMLFPMADQPAAFSYSAAVILITLTCWSASLLPPFLTGLIFFALAITLQLIEPNLLFAGFGSTAVWLIIAGFIIGSAISSSGLDKRLAAVIAPHLTISYPRLIAGLVVSAIMLGFIMPSSIGRAVVLIPVGMALAEKVGFVQGSNGRRGIATALAIACNMPSFAVLPANIPNMILAGSSENLFDVHFGYMEYLLLHFPILGLVKSLVLIWLVLKLFPATISASENSTQAEQQATEFDHKLQLKVLVILGITLLFWVTDSLHGVNAAWVGLVAAILLLMPKFGVLEAKKFNSSIDFGTVIFVSAALGLGTLVNVSGVGETMGEAFIHLLPSSLESTFLSFMSLSLISTVTGLVTTTPGVPTVLTPMAADFAQATGFSVPAVLMTQVIGFSTVIFPYQVAPLIIAMQLAKESLASLLKITLPLALITIVILMPLDYLWWNLLGWIN